MKIYVINLAHEVARRAFQEEQLKSLGLDYEILKATSVDDIDSDTYQRHYYDWQRPLRKAEIACYYSHRNIWQKVISRNQPALVLEDDAILSKNLPVLLPALEKRTDIDLVDLEVFAKKKYVAKTGKALIADYKLFYIHLNSAGTGAYVVYPTGAKKLLAHEAQEGISPSDAHIPSCPHLLAFQIESAIAIQPEFLEFYGLKNPYQEFTHSNTSKAALPGREFIFRLKRTIAQIKLGLYKLRLLPIAHKRFIVLKNKDFIK